MNRPPVIDLADTFPVQWASTVRKEPHDGGCDCEFCDDSGLDHAATCGCRKCESAISVELFAEIAQIADELNEETLTKQSDAVLRTAIAYKLFDGDIERAFSLTEERRDQAWRAITANTEAVPSAALPDKLQIVWADDVQDTAPEWAWIDSYHNKGRILKAALILFAGRPEAGKSTAARWFAAGYSTGTIPGCFDKPINVAYIATEEAWHHTVKPSLRATGADLKRVAFIKRGDNPARINSLQDETELTALLQANNIRAVFLDPLMSTLTGGVDVNRNNEVRDYLDPWMRIAEAIDGPVIGICHLTKAPRGDLLAAITGSSAFGEVPRGAFAFAVDRDAEDGTRIMSQIKNSSGENGLNLAYRIESHRVTTDDGKAADMARFVFIGTSERSARDLVLEEGNTHGTNSGTAKCVKWLRGYLTTHGPTPKLTVTTEATAHGFTAKMLRGARVELEIEVERTREVPSKTLWKLPPEDGRPPHRGQQLASMLSRPANSGGPP